MTLHDALAGRGEDVDVAAARHLDWGDVLNRLDDRRQAILTAMVSGYGTNAIADQIQVSPPRVCQLKESLAGYVTGVWGDNGLAECVKESTWRAGLRAAAERRAGRSERAWQP
jgi:FixJ family two-component response regulator